MLGLVLCATSCASDSKGDARDSGSNDGTDGDSSEGSGGEGAGGAGGAASDAGDSDSDSGGAATPDAADGSGGEGGEEPVLLDIEVAPDLDRHAISPFIYGAMTEDDIESMGATLARLSGNELTAYNWEVNLGLSAWMFGGGEHVSGAIAAADALGIFGREGVTFAAVELAPESPYVAAAFQAFLNFDGKGGRFLDTSVHATTSDRIGSSVYASSDSEQPADLVIVAINKRSFERELTLSIDSDIEYQTAQIYALTEAGSSLGPATPLSAAANAFSYAMPPTSLVVLVPEQ